MTVSVIEIRNYRLKPNVREPFIDYFEEQFLASQEALGMSVLGQFRIVGEPNRFVWMRGFTDMITRLDGLQNFYGGPVWEKYGPCANDMMLEWDNVHLLRPITPIEELTRGVTAETVAADLEAGTISPYVGMIALDFYQALPSQREALIDCLQTQMLARLQREGVEVRGLFVAEMSENLFTRLPVIQNPNEVVVVTAYASEEICQEKRAALKPFLDTITDGLLSAPPDSLLLIPTLRSPLRFVQS